MASVDNRFAVRELASALRDFESAEAEIQSKQWWDGPPPSMEQRRGDAADRVAAAVRELCADEAAS